MLQYGCQLLMYDGCNMVAVWPYLKVVIHQWDGKVAIWYFGNVPIYLPGELLARLPFTCFYTQSSIYVSLTWLCRATLHFDCLARSHKAPKSGALGAWGSIWQPCEKVTKRMHGKVAIYLQDNQNVCMLAGLLEGFYRNHFATLQSTSSCTKSTVFGTFLQTCECDLAFWSHSELLATYASIFLRYFFDISIFFQSKTLPKAHFATNLKGPLRKFA